MAPPAHSRINRYHRWLTRYPALVLVGALAISAAAALLASRLQLKTAFSELLPSNDPGVRTLTRTQKRMGDMSLLLIGVRSPDYAANLRYAEALTQKLRALPPTVVNLATYDVRDLRAFYQQNKWLFVSEDDLESIRDRLRNEISKRKNPLFVSLDEEEPIDKMQKRLEHHDGLDDRFPGGIFTSNNGEYVWIAALPPGGLFVEHAGESLFNKANELINNDPPSRYHPQMTARVSGPIATGIANRQAVVDDIVMVTTSCMVIVILSIGFYFRRLRAIPLTGIPAAIGAAIAFAVADLAFGYLTESTSFLGSIIVGNGINYAIVLMSRYEEHRARGEDPDRALCSAMAGVWRGTLVASIAASAAYASLMVTSFRGFYQFGVMGAVGSLACWVATFTALPALLVLLDRRPEFVTLTFTPLAGAPTAAASSSSHTNDGTDPTNGAVGSIGGDGATGRDRASAMHTHTVSIPASDLDATTDQTLTVGTDIPIGGARMTLDAHMVTLTTTMLTMLKAGGQVTVKSDAAGDSSQAQTFTVGCRRQPSRPIRPPVGFSALGRLLARRSGTVTALFTLLSIGGLFGMRHFLKDPFEYDFSKLSASLKTSASAQQFNHSVDHLFGRWPSPTIVLADGVDEVEPIKQAIRRQDHDFPGPDVIGQVVTVWDLLPGVPEVQERKLALIAQIRKLTHDPSFELLNAKEKADLAKIDPPAGLRELAPGDLPAFARRPFTETDGTIGRVVLVYPPEQGLSVWNGRDLLKIASVLQYLHLPNGKVVETSGSAVVFSSMIRSILRDGPIATAASLIAVLIIISFTIRPAAAAVMALTTLMLGVLLMVGGAGWAQVRVTFLNFIALPITFGIGAEYALNVITRYREEKDVVKAVVSTGAAVALCSWTTIVGYGSLLAARNRALQGFGLMAILGEVSCLSAAIIVLPAVLLWRRARPLYEKPETDTGLGATTAPPLDGEPPPSTTV